MASLFSSAFFPKDFPCPLGLSLHQECTRACLGWDVQFLCFPIRACLERRARLRIVCCSIISISALAVWVGYPAVALSAGRREFHYLLLAEEKGIEIFLVIFILSLVWCFLAILFFFFFLLGTLLFISGFIFSPTGRLEEYLNCMDKIQKAVEYFQDNNPDSPELNRVVGDAPGTYG